MTLNRHFVKIINIHIFLYFPVRFYDNVFSLTIFYMVFSASSYNFLDKNFRCRYQVPNMVAVFLDSYIINYFIFSSEKVNFIHIHDIFEFFLKIMFTV